MPSISSEDLETIKNALYIVKDQGYNVVVEELDDIINRSSTHRIDVLDHGFIELVDWMGDDHSVANAARVSYLNHEKRRKFGERNEGKFPKNTDGYLTQYLLENKHTSPFEMIELKFVIQLPIFVARQWVRHRTASLNESSARYTELPELYYSPHVWRRQDAKNKQSSGGSIDNQIAAKLIYSYIEDQNLNTEMELRKLGVANEMARLPMSVSRYTQWVWKIDLHNFLHFLLLRDDPHAQWEIQEYAKAARILVTEKFPRIMEIVDYIESQKKEEEKILNLIRESNVSWESLSLILNNISKKNTAEV